jgi:PfpI family intracellular protease
VGVEGEAGRAAGAVLGDEVGFALGVRLDPAGEPRLGQLGPAQLHGVLDVAGRVDRFDPDQTLEEGDRLGGSIAARTFRAASTEKAGGVGLASVAGRVISFSSERTKNPRWAADGGCSGRASILAAQTGRAERAWPRGEEDGDGDRRQRQEGGDGDRQELRGLRGDRPQELPGRGGRRGDDDRDERGTVEGKKGGTLAVDATFGDVSPDEFDLLVIPGGGAPENLRIHPPAVEFTRSFVESGKPVGSICHGPQLLISAKVLGGRTLTAVNKIADDVVNAGATYVDEPLVVDGNLITSRVPADLPCSTRRWRRRWWGRR